MHKVTVMYQDFYRSGHVLMGLKKKTTQPNSPPSPNKQKNNQANTRKCFFWSGIFPTLLHHRQRTGTKTIRKITSCIGHSHFMCFCLFVFECYKNRTLHRQTLFFFFKISSDIKHFTSSYALDGLIAVSCHPKYNSWASPQSWGL